MTSLFRKLRYPRRCYVVCGNLLTDGLPATRRAGRPNQFFCELLRQAIAKARAYQSGQWKVHESEEVENSASFDSTLIERCLNENQREEDDWSRFFEQTGAQAFEIVYEEFCRDYETTLRAVFDFLQICLPRRTQIGTPLTIRQRDELSREWEERYRSLGRSSELVHS